MADHIFQARRGASFSESLQGYLTRKIVVSGYEPRSSYSSERFWWAVVATKDNELEVICGRVSAFDGEGWGYKISSAESYDKPMPNPPLNVRKKIVAKGLKVKGVYESGVTEPRFALMMVEELRTQLERAVVTGDHEFILAAIENLKESASLVYLDIVEEQSSRAMRPAPSVSPLVLDRMLATADQQVAEALGRANGLSHIDISLDTAQASTLLPLLKPWVQTELMEQFPELALAG